MAEPKTIYGFLYDKRHKSVFVVSVRFYMNRGWLIEYDRIRQGDRRLAFIRMDTRHTFAFDVPLPKPKI